MTGVVGEQEVLEQKINANQKNNVTFAYAMGVFALTLERKDTRA